MGQYQALYCIDTRTALMPGHMDCFTKAIEQLWEPKITAALALMCAAGFPDAAFPQAGTPRGAWAGKRIVLIGDYAENGDLRGAPFAQHGMPAKEVYEELYGRATTRVGATAQRPSSIGAAVRPHLDALFAMEPSSTGHGQDAGLWVSLDSREYVDTAAFGAHDLRSAVALDGWRPFLISALAQPGVRGGGDLSGDHGLGAIGRWRGDRIVFLGPDGMASKGTRLTIADVRATMADITGFARFVGALHARDEDTRSRATVTWEDEGGVESTVQADLAHARDLQQDLLRAVAQYWPELRAPRDGQGQTGMDAPTMPTLVIRPTTIVEVRDGRKRVVDRFTVPFQATLEDSEDGRLWLPTDVRAKLRDALDGPSPAVWWIQAPRTSKEPDWYQKTWKVKAYHVGWGPTRFLRFPSLTAHTQMQLEAAMA